MPRPTAGSPPTGSGYDGFTVAQAVHTALTGGDVNACIYWYAASTGCENSRISPPPGAPSRR
ncbi:hypothetical protein [Nonomuraea sp. NPDC002799]